MKTARRGGRGTVRSYPEQPYRRRAARAPPAPVISWEHRPLMTHDDFIILIFLLIAVVMGGIILAGVLILMWRNPQNKG